MSSQHFDTDATLNHMHHFCEHCGAEVLSGENLCPGCENEQNNACRWCGSAEPLHGQAICGHCSEINDLIADTGSYENAAVVLRFRMELDALL